MPIELKYGQYHGGSRYGSRRVDPSQVQLGYLERQQGYQRDRLAFQENLAEQEAGVVDQQIYKGLATGEWGFPDATAQRQYESSQADLSAVMTDRMISEPQREEALRKARANLRKSLRMAQNRQGSSPEERLQKHSQMQQDWQKSHPGTFIDPSTGKVIKDPAYVAPGVKEAKEQQAKDKQAKTEADRALKRIGSAAQLRASVAQSLAQTKGSPPSPEEVDAEIERINKIANPPAAAPVLNGKADQDAANIVAKWKADPASVSQEEIDYLEYYRSKKGGAGP